MSFGNPSELFFLARICFLHLMLFSISACLVFVASTERKIGLLPSMAIHLSVTTCDACAVDDVLRFTRPSPSVFEYCKRSKTGAGEGLGTRLIHNMWQVASSVIKLVTHYFREKIPYLHAQHVFCWWTIGWWLLCPDIHVHIYHLSPASPVKFVWKLYGYWTLSQPLTWYFSHINLFTLPVLILAFTKSPVQKRDREVWVTLSTVGC